MRNQITVSKEWLHACGHREFESDTAFEVVNHCVVRGVEFWDVKVPWQDRFWTVSEWRLAR